MADQYIVEGSSNPTVDWTTEVILARDDEGKPTKVVGATKPSELNQSDRSKLEKLGLKVKKISADEAEKLEGGAAAGAGEDIAGAAPSLGSGKKEDKEEKEVKQDG